MPTGAPDAPFLAARPLPRAVRGLSTVLIAIFVTALLLALFAKLPETVTSSFVLVPVHGTDPLRAPREGIVEEVGVLEGQAVGGGDLLFRLRSETVDDRRSELRTAETKRRGARESLANEREAYASRRRADEEEERRLETQARELEERLELKRGALEIAADVLERQRRLFEQGLLSQTEFSEEELTVRRERIGVEELEAALADAQAGLLRQQHEAEARAVAHREEVRRLEEEIQTADIRIAALRDALTGDASGLLAITAPCTGTVLRLLVQSPGAFVQDGDTLAEIACSDEPLRARLTVPQAFVALVEPGQQVKLLYEAFPYQRYGVRFGEVESVNPAGVDTGAGRVFRALARVSESSVRVRGRDRPILAGMAGSAKIIVGHRSVASYAVEPLRRLREAVRSRPPAG